MSFWKAVGVVIVALLIIGAIQVGLGAWAESMRASRRQTLADE